MNKLLLTLGLLLTCTVAFSQKMDLIDAIDKLDLYAKTQFKEITDKKLSVDSNEYDVKTTFAPKLIINGAKSCKIMENRSRKSYSLNPLEYEYIAWYGDFKTIDEAYKKADELESQLKKAGKGFRFDLCDQFLTSYKNRVLVQDKTGKIKVYNIIVDIQENKAKSIFSISLKFRSDKLSKEYTLVDVEQSGEDICRQIRTVIQSAEKNFEDLKGSKIPSEDDQYSEMFDILSPKYYSTLQLPGSTRCYIDAGLMSTKFVIETAANLDNENANKILEQLFRTVGYSLGKGYAYCASEDNSTIDFVKLQQYNYSCRLIAIAQVKMQLVNNHYDSFIYIFPPDKIFSE